MKFVCMLYILIVIFTENKEKFLVRSIADLGETELVHLSQKLSIFECLQLMKAVYELTPARVTRKINKREVLGENLDHLSTTSKECLVNLEQWNNDFPKNAKLGGRSTMEISLRWLGRADLAKYVRENRRSINFLNTEDYDIADTLEFPGHRVSRRQTPENGKHSSTREKKKKKRARQNHSQISIKRNKKAHGVAATRHITTHKTHQVKKKENKSQNKKDYLEQHRSVCCSILFVVLFLTLCVVAAYFLRRRNRSMARGTRFKYKWATPKQDKNTFTDNLDWNDDAVCSCSDIEGECTGKCPICKRNNQIQDVASHRTGSDLNTVCMQKPKDKKGKRRQRFSFLQKNFQDRKKEKDQENRNRKCVRRENAGTIEYEDHKMHFE